MLQAIRDMEAGRRMDKIFYSLHAFQLRDKATNLPDRQSPRLSPRTGPARRPRPGLAQSQCRRRRRAWTWRAGSRSYHGASPARMVRRQGCPAR